MDKKRESEGSPRLKTVRVGHFKVRINPKAGLMTEDRGELVRRFKRYQSQLGPLSFPLPSMDEEVRSARKPTLPSREGFNRSLEDRMGLERGSVTSRLPPVPRSSRFRPSSVTSPHLHDDDDDDDDKDDDDDDT